MAGPNSRSFEEFPDNQLERFRTFFNQAQRASEIWRVDTKEDYSFVEGYGQWTQKDKNTLIQQNRPALVMNSILPVINLISGQERASRLGITYKPRGLNDDRYALIANATYHYVNDVAGIPYEISDAFVDMIICGRGYVHFFLESIDNDPMGEIMGKRVHPLSQFIDPAASRYDLQDARYWIHAKWIDMQDFKVHYKNELEGVNTGDWLNMAPDLIGEKTLNESWRNTRKNQIRLLDIWYKEPKQVYMIITSTGEIQQFNTKKEAIEARNIIAKIARLQKVPVLDLEVVSRVTKKVKHAVVTYWHILKQEEDPLGINMYPFVPFTAYHFDEVLSGVVRSMKDPQREKNKRWSQMLHIINTMAKGGWKIPKGSISQEQFNKWGTEAGKPGFFFEYAAQIGAPQEIQGQNLPTSFISLMQIAEDEGRKSSGAVQELLGLSRAPDQSGKAINILKNSGATILAPLFDSLVRSHKISGKIIISLVKNFFTIEKIKNILDESEANQITNAELDIMDFIKTALGIDYDVVVDVTPLIGSERERQFNQVIDLIDVLAKSGTPPPPSLLEVVYEVSDFPNKEKILEELRQTGAFTGNQQGGQIPSGQMPQGGI